MPSCSPTAILFDIDGTLMDDDRAVFLALSSFHASHGRELGLSLEGLTSRWRDLLNLHFARYLAGEISMQEQRRARVVDLFATTKPLLTPAEADSLFATYLSHYRASWCAYPDALPALAALGGFGLAVLSNGDQSQQSQKLRNCALDTYFSEIITSSDTGWAKPAPETFLSACRRLGIPPGRCVYVGDNVETDARASASAGMISVWLDRARSGTDPGPGIQVIHGLAEVVALYGHTDGASQI
jgi:putative hydrolase of the HAD superfamily